MKYILRRCPHANRTGAFIHKDLKLLAYADDIDIIGKSERAVSKVFSEIEKKSNLMGLAVNEDKTKYLVSADRKSLRLGQSVTMGEYNFNVLKDFVYLGTTITSKNNISLEIRRRTDATMG